MRVDKHGAIGVGITERIGHGETGAPRFGAFAFAGAFDLDVVSGPFARAVKPADEEIALGSFDNARGMIVPHFERKEEFGIEEGLGAC